MLDELWPSTEASAIEKHSSKFMPLRCSGFLPLATADRGSGDDDLWPSNSGNGDLRLSWVMTMDVPCREFEEASSFKFVTVGGCGDGDGDDSAM